MRPYPNHPIKRAALHQHRALAESVAGYGILLSAASFEVQHYNGDDRDIALVDGRCFSPRKFDKVVGVIKGSEGSTASAITARQQTTAGVWVRQRRWLRCRHAPLRRRLQHLFAMASATFLY